MTYKDAFHRAVATFVAGAASAPVSAAVLDLNTVKAVAVAGVAAVLNLVVRWAQAYLETHGEV